MKEKIEFRIFPDYYHLLSTPNNAKYNGMVYIIEVDKDTPLYNEIGLLDTIVRDRHNEPFFGSLIFKRIYTKTELHSAQLFQFTIKKTFEPEGENQGTVYDHTFACPLCLGAYGRKQIGALKLPKGKIPRKDISRTIAGEYVVSKRFAEIVEKWGIRGVVLGPIVSGKHIIDDFFQLYAAEEVSLSDKTIAQDNPWTTKDVVEASTFYIQGYKVSFEKEYHRCQTGHLIGSRLISEAIVNDCSELLQKDYLWSAQRVGIKQGVLYPEPVHLCSPRFRQMVIEEKLTGFDFEVAYIDKE